MERTCERGRMQLPGLDELETSVAKAIETMASLRGENARLMDEILFPEQPDAPQRGA